MANMEVQRARMRDVKIADSVLIVAYCCQGK